MPGIVAVARLWLTIGITWFLISFFFLHLFFHTKTTKIAAATNTNRDLQPSVTLQCLLWWPALHWPPHWPTRKGWPCTACLFWGHWVKLEEGGPCGQWLSCTFGSVWVTEFQKYFDFLQASAAHRSLWETNIWPWGHWGRPGARSWTVSCYGVKYN